MAEHIIWQNYDLNLKDWREGLLEENPDANEDKLYRMMVELNQDYLDDERANLNKNLGSDIIMVADIGRWNGRFNGYKYIRSGNIRDCLRSSVDCDYAKWYVDDSGEFRCSESHHDATNYIRYRVLKSDLSDEMVEELEDAVTSYPIKEDVVQKLTLPIGPHIAEIYGWELKGGACA